MKKIIVIALLIISCAAAMAQAPNNLSYQAVVRTPSGELLINQVVSFRATLIQRGIADSIVMIQPQTLKTDEYGMFSTDIEFENLALDWHTGNIYLQIDIDPKGGSDYTLSSKQRLTSVPYALNTNSTDSIRNFHWEEKQVLSRNADTIFLTGGSWVKLPPRFDGDYNHLTNTPVNISTFTNDAGYLVNEVQVLTISGRRIFLTGGSYVDVPYGFSGNYNDLTNKPTIPTALSDLANDAGYLTGESQILTISNDTIFLTGGSFVKLPPYDERQGLADVTAFSPSAGNRQLKDLVDPTDPQDAITYKYLMDELLNWDSDTAKRGNVYTINTCDQYLWNGVYYHQSGTYTHSYSNGDNYYVVDTLLLTIRNSSHQTIPVQSTTSYTWHGIDYSSTGNYVYQYINTVGCPSSDTLRFTIITGSECASTRSCWDTAQVYNCGAFQWYDQIIRREGIYSHNLGPVAQGGCDSVVDIYVQILEVPRHDTTMRVNTSVTWRGHTYTTPNDYFDTIHMAGGCDSIFTLHLMAAGDLGIGAAPGVYSVSPTRKVKFAHGNLQYQSSSDRWKFAEKQYYRSAITCLSEYYPSWSDLFGWGTSGYHNYQDTLNTNYHPWSRKSESADPGTDAFDHNLYGYGPSTNMADTNLSGTSKNYDWGAYNPIMNGGNGGDLWRTLTKDEWEYLLRGRPGADDLCGFATIINIGQSGTSVSGYVILSDDWTAPSGIGFNPHASDIYGNFYDTNSWNLMEAAGAVFLPFSDREKEYAMYWSSSSEGPGGAYAFSFSSFDTAIAAYNRSTGLCVRLVQDYQPGVSECTCTYYDTNIISNGPMTWNGQTYTESGDYFNIIRNSQGCDSIITMSFILVEPGVLNGYFSVNDTHQVSFSKGNLQYKASAGIWRLANKQYEYFGDQNRYRSANYSGWIDLFCWATSGYHDPTDVLNTAYQPYHSYNDGSFGPSINMSDWDLVNTSANYDWGVYNTIPNGGNSPGNFRTLLSDEWSYLLDVRPNAYLLRALGEVHGVNGLILLPDNWTDIPGITLDHDQTYSYHDYESNIITDSQWAQMEMAGAVFLPAGGSYDWDVDIKSTGEFGTYWSSTRWTQGYLNEWRDAAMRYEFGQQSYYWWVSIVDRGTYLGSSVRLVKDR